MTDDVLIAGAGPVGMTLALALGLDGHRVTVCEAGAELSSESRASTFHPATLDVLDRLGLVERLRELAVLVPDYQYRDRREGVIARFDYAAIAGDTRFPFRLQVEQSKLTRIILDRLADLPDVTVRFGSPVTGVRLADDGSPEVSVGDEVLRPRYLVGADGANSIVRRALGIGFEGITYPERYLVASTPFEFRDVLPDLSWVNYVSDPEEWLLMLRTPEHWRLLFPLPPNVEKDEAQAEDSVQARLQGVYPLGRPYPVLHTTVYNVHQRVADTYAVGRVVLAGDAAHINNPLGGLGMNSGIHDAFALRSAFQQIADGGDEEKLFEEYATARRRVSVDYVGAQTDQNWARIRESDPRRRREQALNMREIVADPARAREFLLRVSMLKEELA